MYRYYYTFEADGILAGDEWFCADAESAIDCGKEMEAGGFWVVQYSQPGEYGSGDDLPLDQCTYIGKIYIPCKED